jgi:hypothetical protein
MIEINHLVQTSTVIMHWDKENKFQTIVAGKRQTLWKDPVDMLMFSPDILGG